MKYPAKDLSAHNTLGVSSNAQYYAAATSVEEVQAACAWACQQRIRLLVLGGGSNIIPAPQISALVLKPDIKGITPVEASNDYQLVDIGAGENWHQVVLYCLAQGWYGLENLSLIPGSVGAAPVQNIGAYGVELSNLFDSLQAVNIGTGKEETFDLERCAFGYRDSVFKTTQRGKYVITRVRLRLSLQPRVAVHYPALADALAGIDEKDITPLRVSEAVCALRARKLPDPVKLPNCGSFFKNPIVSDREYNALKDRYPNLIAFAMPDERKKLAAGWLIEQAGWKGKDYQGILVHTDQALVLTNPKHLDAEYVMAAANAIQVDIKNKFGVALEVEPQQFA